MKLFLSATTLATLLLSGPALPQPLRSQEKSGAEQEAISDAPDLIDQILDLNFLMNEKPAYSTQTPPWGSALLPDPSYDPNFRVPESERIYPPGYLERRRQKLPEATQ